VRKRRRRRMAIGRSAAVDEIYATVE